ncbi:histidine triad nucleotide-binding protein [soil metagenome]
MPTRASAPDTVSGMPADCLFCKIIAGEIPANVLHDGAKTLSFADLNPQAPTHVLVVPKVHVQDLSALGADPDTAAALVTGISDTAAALGLRDYRTVFNTGAAVGQSVFHVHAHLLAGRAFGWPPG